MQRVWMQSGETLVLAGFERYDRGVTKDGLIDASFWFFGGQRAARNNRESIVITITPMVSAGYKGI